MGISCTSCRKTIFGDSDSKFWKKITGWQSKWFSGKDKDLLCEDCYEDFKKQAIQENVGIMDRGEFIFIYNPPLFKKLKEITVCAFCGKKDCSNECQDKGKLKSKNDERGLGYLCSCKQRKVVKDKQIKSDLKATHQKEVKK